MITQHQPLPRTPATALRRVAWFAIACAAASFALTIANRLEGGSVRWTAWTLPLLIATNSYVLLLGGLRRWPRLTRLYFALSLAIAGAVIVAELRILLHR